MMNLLSDRPGRPKCRRRRRAKSQMNENGRRGDSRRSLEGPVQAPSGAAALGGKRMPKAGDAPKWGCPHVSFDSRNRVNWIIPYELRLSAGSRLMRIRGWSVRPPADSLFSIDPPCFFLIPADLGTNGPHGGRRLYNGARSLSEYVHRRTPADLQVNRKSDDRPARGRAPSRALRHAGAPAAAGEKSHGAHHVRLRLRARPQDL